MKFNLKWELQKFDFYADKLRKNKCIVELTEVRKPRTIQQNKYLHVIIHLCAITEGYNLDEMKTRLKRKCEFMRYKKKGETFLKRSRDLDTKGMAEWVDWIRNYGPNEAGYYIPSPDDYLRNWAEIEREIEQHKTYL